MTSLLARDSGLKLHNEADALDIIGSGLRGCILTPDDLHPDFFVLSNRIAGTVFQKFVNYNYRVAIIVGEDHEYGARVTELMRDHRRHPCIRFFSSVDEAESWLIAERA